MNTNGQITAGSYLEALRSHSGVINQPDWDHKWFSGINVYALGFAMMMDIKRMCEKPDNEDRKYFPELCNTDWKVTIPNIVANYRDESFILQFLSLKVVRQLKLFALHMDEEIDFYQVTRTHDDDDLIRIRKALAKNTTYLFLLRSLKSIL